VSGSTNVTSGLVTSDREYRSTFAIGRPATRHIALGHDDS
jgi:hypothetical protein